MRAGADRLLSIVVNTVGAAHAHHGYLFAQQRESRVKLLVHDGFGVWCATRRLHAGRSVWLERSPAQVTAAATLQLTAQQFEGLAVGFLPRDLCDTCPQFIAIRCPVVRAGQASHNPWQERISMQTEPCLPIPASESQLPGAVHEPQVPATSRLTPEAASKQAALRAIAGSDMRRPCSVRRPRA
jgi:hypothetical protein